MPTVGVHIGVEFDEDDKHTKAALLLRLREAEGSWARNAQPRGPASAAHR